jgi:hypothetical protein
MTWCTVIVISVCSPWITRTFVISCPTALLITHKNNCNKTIATNNCNKTIAINNCNKTIATKQLKTETFFQLIMPVVLIISQYINFDHNDVKRWIFFSSKISNFCCTSFFKEKLQRYGLGYQKVTTQVDLLTSLWK